MCVVEPLACEQSATLMTCRLCGESGRFRSTVQQRGRSVVSSEVSEKTCVATQAGQFSESVLLGAVCHFCGCCPCGVDRHHRAPHFLVHSCCAVSFVVLLPECTLRFADHARALLPHLFPNHSSNILNNPAKVHGHSSVAP